MAQEVNKQLKFFLVYLLVPAIILLVVTVAFYVIAYEGDKNEFEPTDTRGHDALETGQLDRSLFDWRPSYSQERA